MTLKDALKSQYRAGLAMMRDCLVKCPDDVWTQGRHPRNFWRIAYHGLFYTHLYMVQNAEAHSHFFPEPGDRDCLWASPPVESPFTKSQLLDYLDFLVQNVDPIIDGLDLEAPTSGYHWYPNHTKLEHELLNLRHLMGHVGQLSEILMAHDIDTDWVSRG